ncbi:hypothetical protein [Rhizobium alvei]|uniref:Uncharacterized protein n=1 Tax=Rhizobium alvei TaxID=1132659 RepID=A0ABT8YL13_9HYPH|nr:hypothetical protein [Rhizobium alvei]MDO6964322.1 hypothetical protein [Rhizobium alvei]
MRFLTTLFETFDDAARAIRALKAICIAEADISFVTRCIKGAFSATSQAGKTKGTNAAEQLQDLHAGVGVMNIPGIGPAAVAGKIARQIADTEKSDGAETCLVSVLMTHGLEEREANIHAECIRQGDTLLVVRLDDDRQQDIETTCSLFSRVDVEKRFAAFAASGWFRFDIKSALPAC